MEIVILLCYAIYRETNKEGARTMEEHSVPMTEAMYYVLSRFFARGTATPCMQRVRERSAGVVMGPGTLYGVLTRMRQDGWIIPDATTGPQGLPAHPAGPP
jgi:hypothetical protein